MGEGDKFPGAQKATDNPVMRIKGDPEFIPVAKLRCELLQDVVIVEIVSRNEGFQKCAYGLEISLL